MSFWNCMFGHKFEVTHSIREQVLDADSEFKGYNVYVIKKCSKCEDEVGYKTDYYWNQTKRISVDYIKGAFFKELSK